MKKQTKNKISSQDTPNEKTATTPKPPAVLPSREAKKELKARILLRKVDSDLKNKGINAAFKALMKARLEVPRNSTIINDWFDGYRDMLDAWKYRLMPEVVKEFEKYGFRRARTLASQHLVVMHDENRRYFFAACERVLGEMADRSRLAIRDIEDEKPEAKPNEVSLDDVSEQELEQGTKL
jgi:hypothetical protein